MKKFIPDVFIILGTWLVLGNFMADSLSNCSSSWPHDCSIEAASIGLFFLLIGLDIVIRKFLYIKQIKNEK